MIIVGERESCSLKVSNDIFIYWIVGYVTVTLKTIMNFPDYIPQKI